MKKETLNCVLFWDKKDLNPHSNGDFFSLYGLCVANIKFKNNNTRDKKGINKKNNILLLI